MLKSVFFRRLVIMLSVAMLIAAAVMLGGYVFLSKDVYADIKLDELHPSLDAAEQLAKEYMAGEIDKDVFERLAAKLLPSNTGTVLYLDAAKHAKKRARCTLGQRRRSACIKRRGSKNERYCPPDAGDGYRQGIRA